MGVNEGVVVRGSCKACFAALHLIDDAMICRSLHQLDVLIQCRLQEDTAKLVIHGFFSGVGCQGGNEMVCSKATQCCATVAITPMCQSSRNLLVALRACVVNGRAFALILHRQHCIIGHQEVGYTLRLSPKCCGMQWCAIRLFGKAMQVGRLDEAVAEDDCVLGCRTLSFLPTRGSAP